MGIQVSLALNGLIALALSWMTDQTEFSATCASNGLFSTDFLNVMGPFHKTLPLHIFRKKSDSLHDFIERLKEMQPLWMHLREYPFDLLVRAQNKKIVKKLLPKKILPLLRILRRLWSRQINLFINELELKSFAHFSDVHSERLPHRGQNDPFQIKVLSLLSQKDWEVHIIWPLSPDNQRQLSKNIDSLLNEFTQKILVK